MSEMIPNPQDYQIMQLWMYLCFIVGASWAWNILMAFKKIGNIWIGIVLGLIVGVGLFWLFGATGAWIIRRLKLYQYKLSMSRLVLSWPLVGVTAVFAFAAPWCVNLLADLFTGP